MASTQLSNGLALPRASGSDLVQADDATLARSLMNRDPHAPRVAWARFSPIVRGMLRRSLGPEFDVEDIVQDVFLRLFQKIHGLREPTALRAFVMSITIRTVRYEIRRKRVRRWVGLTTSGDVSDLRRVEPNVEAREALLHFYRVLDQLGTRDRAAFVLHFIEGLDVGIVAETLNVSVPTVRRCLTRARSRVVLLAGRDPSLVDYVARLAAQGKPE